MNFKNTFFHLDPMVVYKPSVTGYTKVVRLDHDYFLEFEDRLATLWEMIANKKSFQELLTYLTSTCGLTQAEAESSLNEFVEMLENENLGTVSQIQEVL